MTAEDINIICGDNVFKIVDVETTGFNFGNGDRITDICIYTVDGDTVVGVYKTLINPERNIPENIQKLTGITDSMVKWAPKFIDVAGQIYERLSSGVIVGHNVSFDLDRFLIPSFKTWYGAPKDFQRIDTMTLARTFSSNLNSFKLQDVYEELTGDKQRVMHRAEADVRMTYEVFKRYREFIKFNYSSIIQAIGNN